VKQVLRLTIMMLVTRTVLGQSPPPRQASPAPTIRSTSTLVMVPALVLSESGKLGRGLGASDFRLTDNGIEQKISVEVAEPQSLAVVVLIQTGGTAPRHFKDYRKLGAVIENMMGAPRHRVALVTFDSRLEEIWNFPPMVDGLTGAFRYPQSGDQGAALIDAMICGINLLEQQAASHRRIIILLSQRQDNGSEATPEELVRRLGESNITVYSVTFSPQKTRKEEQGVRPLQGDMHFRLSPDHGLLAGKSGSSEPLDIASEAAREDTAAAVAALSGGENLRFADSSDLESALSILTSDISGGYTLNFRPSSNEPGLHIIKVQLKKKANLDVTARASHWSLETPTKN